MDLQTYLGIVRKHWRVVPLVVLIVVAATASITYLIPRQYESQLQFFVSTVDTSDNSQLAQGSTFLQQRVKSYSQLLTAPVVLQPVVKDLKLHTTANELARQVSADIPTDTVLIDVTVRDPNPAQAQKIASSIGEHFPATIARIETVSSKANSPVKVTVTKPPTFQPNPVSPRPIQNLALALVFGLLLSLGIALLRHTLDTRVRSKEDVDNLVEDIPTIGLIPYDSDATTNPLLREAGPSSMRSESFRALRTNMAFIGTGERRQTIVMTSSIPGEGKTTTTANLALVLAQTGASVCLIEADLRRPRLLEYFGLEGTVGLTDLLIGRADLADVLQPFGRQELVLLGAGEIPPNPSELLGSPAMRECLQELASKFDYVLLDAPPLLPVTDAAVASTLADGAIMVVGSALVTRDQLTAGLERLQAVNARVLGIVLNRLPRNVSGGHYYDYTYQYQARHQNPAPSEWASWEDPRDPETASAEASSQL